MISWPRLTEFAPKSPALLLVRNKLSKTFLIAIVCGGHALLEGVPGLGKTALVNTISQALDLKFQRIQFTPDLLPADIVGTQILLDKDGRKELQFQPGPVFCNILLADEINRATPKNPIGAFGNDAGKISHGSRNDALARVTIFLRSRLKTRSNKMALSHCQKPN